MWYSDNIVIRLAKMLGGLVATAVLVMLWLTIIFSFPEQEDNPNGTALVKSCEDTGPITRRGFGHNWNCTAEVRDDETGKTWTSQIDMNFFTPEDIGKEKKLIWGYGGSRTSHNTEKRTYTRVEDGYSSATNTLVAIVATGVVGIPALLMLSTALNWIGTQEEQRKWREKLHGTPEERAAKKRKEREADERFRERQARIAAARKQAKEERQQKKR